MLTKLFRSFDTLPSNYDPGTTMTLEDPGRFQGHMGHIVMTGCREAITGTALELDRVRLDQGVATAKL